MKYEYGESLKDLSIKYKVPEITLKKRKKLDELKGDPWVKGFRSTEGYKEFVETNERKKEAINTEITLKAKKEMAKIDAIIEKFYSDGAILIPEIEKAHAIRLERILKQVKAWRIIEGIYTPEEQLNIDLLKIALENKKLEASIKSAELKNKKIELAFNKEKAQAYGVDVDE